ncbi:AAA family ATPase [Blastococcus saxobsidens]|uniref:CO dehydrogenase maturation factor n=1 Tax=Blastococcus saxobsidens TaxID=138336 RepID=A0A4Q7Y4C6_9ACTN|nr:ArsA-related P-loop ATPase [Blastococcus saxobsidens]RZU31777.1 CO dehydrogenase maturation factor [Blastococcus saxobsidens]
MRIAVAGKGGAGKTTISATLARLTARRGGLVVAVDADANPNLAPALGVSAQVAAGLRAVPPALVSRRRGGTGLTEPVESVLDRHAVLAPDGVRLMGMGAPAHAEEGCLCSAHAVVASLLEDLRDGPGRTVVVDMEASPEHLSRGTVRHVDVVCLVAEPYYRSLETVRRMGALVAELPVPRTVVIANKIRSAADEEAVTEFCTRHGLALCGTVPWCDAVTAADGAGVPVVDWPGTAPVVAAVERLASRLGIPAGSVASDRGAARRG